MSDGQPGHCTTLFAYVQEVLVLTKKIPFSWQQQKTAKLFKFEEPSVYSLNKVLAANECWRGFVGLPFKECTPAWSWHGLSSSKFECLAQASMLQQGWSPPSCCDELWENSIALLSHGIAGVALGYQQSWQLPCEAVDYCILLSWVWECCARKTHLFDRTHPTKLILLATLLIN